MNPVNPASRAAFTWRSTERRFVAVIGAVGGKIRRILDPLVDRIDLSPMTPFVVDLRIAVPTVIEGENLPVATSRVSAAGDYQANEETVA